MQYGSGSWGFDDPRDIWYELALADLRSLGRRGFRLYGPTAPLLSSPTLASWERHNSELVLVVLAHGEHFAPEGPYVQVQTASAAAGQRSSSLHDVIEDERDRLYEHAGIDEGEYRDLPVESEPWFTIDGIPVRAALRVEGRLWAARLSLGGPDCPLRSRGGEPVTLTVTGRGVTPDRVGLRTVEDLEPYAVGRQERLAALAARRSQRRGPSGPEQPEPVGLDAHRRLVEYSVQHALRVEAALESGHPPREPRSGREDDSALWESAVRQQMRLAGEERAAANDAVTALVNQMVQLARRVDWFPGSPDARAAVEESIRYTVFDSEVASVDAQRAWRAQWSRHDFPSDRRGPDRRERQEQQIEADAQWLGLWQNWRERLAAGG